MRYIRLISYEVYEVNKLHVYMYVWIYENEAKGVKSRTIRSGRFFSSSETISKVDDIKIKRIVSPFFLPLLLYLAFTAVLSLFLARFHGLEVALGFREIKVKKEF